VLIFVFAGISYGRAGTILAEFAPVPNAPSDVDSLRPAAAVAGPVPVPQAGPATEIPVSVERGGPQGLEPTRFGDWERNGRCIDF
jgi:hypothetical protein